MISDGFEQSALSPREKAVIGYVDTFLTDPHGLGDGQRQELLAHLTAEELVELTAGVALFMGFSKIAIALGPPPDMPTQVVPTPGVADDGQP